MFVLSLILSTWLFLFIAFCGIGLVVRRYFGLKVYGVENLITSFWIGWAYAIFSLQLWNIFFRVDWRPLVAISIMGIFGLLWNYKDLASLFKRQIFIGIFFGFILILTAVWLAELAALPILNTDSGLYHLSSIRWVKTFPVVPGLGNLHGRLAFNSSYFLYIAALEVGLWVHRSHHIANGLLMLVLFMQIYISAIKIFRCNDRLPLYFIFNILIYIPLIKQGYQKPFNISSPSPDLPIFILGIILASQLLAFLESPKLRNKEDAYNLFSIATIAAVGITIKLSFLILGGVTLLLVCIIWFIQGNGHKIAGKKVIFWIIAGLTIGLIPWVIRGVILSGYIAYPSTFGSFPVEWRIPLESVISERNWIFSWARVPRVHPDQVLGNWNWITPWFDRMKKNTWEIVIPLLLTGVGFLTTLFYKVIKKNYPHRERMLWLFLIPSIVSLLYWFFTAPEPRFAGAAFWILGVGTITLSIRYLSKLKNLVILVFTLSAFLFISLALQPLSRDIWRLHKFYSIPRAELKTFTTDSGLVIYVPKEGDMCWDAPLPCTPYPNKSLTIRKDGELRWFFLVSTR